MPSSLIIVALAAAWLVVLVPMVARKRQAVAQTADTELAARVVRSGSGADEGEEEVVSAEEIVLADDDHDAVFIAAGEILVQRQAGMRALCRR